MDIKISLEIGLSPALEGFLGKFLGGAQQPAPVAREVKPAASVVEQSQELARENPVEDPQPEAGEPQKRTRRTKAQMEADAAAQATGNAGSTSQQADGSSDGSTATTAASLSDALDAAEEPVRQGVTTKADVAAKMMELAGTPGWSPKKVQDQMKEHLNGATNMSTLAEADYGAAIALFDRLMAA